MTAITTRLEIPLDVLEGIAGGDLERVGGVVRDVTSKKVVMWLREGTGSTNQVPSQVFGSAAQSLSALSGAGLILNLGISAVTMIATLNRLSTLQDSINNLSAEFNRDRGVDFESALESAEDAMRLSNPNRRHDLADAVKALRSPRKQLETDLKIALKAEYWAEAQYFLTCAMYAVTSMARCCLEMDDYDGAMKNLTEQRQTYAKYARQIVTGLLGEKPAIYLYRDVASEDVRRFISVIEWVGQQEFIELLIETLRMDFWNEEVIEIPIKDFREPVDDFFSRLRGEKISRSNQRNKRLVENLGHAEAIIENINRLEGFELEVRSMRLTGHTFEEWQQLTSSGDDFTILIPEQPIDLFAAN